MAGYTKKVLLNSDSCIRTTSLVLTWCRTMSSYTGNRKRGKPPLEESHDVTWIFFLTHSLPTSDSMAAYECFLGHQTFVYVFIDWLILCYVYFDYICVLHYLHAWYLWMPWGWACRWLWVTMWVLGIEPGLSEKADSVLNHWAISTATKHSIINYYESNYWLWQANLQTSSQRGSHLIVGHYHTTKLRQCITVETMHHSQVQRMRAF